MKRKVIGNVEPKCQYCKHGTLSSDNKKILCLKKGVFAKNYSCKKFCYDPFKRIPVEMPALPEYSPDDFKL